MVADTFNIKNIETKYAFTTDIHNEPGIFVVPTNVWCAASSSTSHIGERLAMSTSNGLMRVATELDGNHYEGMGYIQSIDVNDQGYSTVSMVISNYAEERIDPLKECCQNCEHQKTNNESCFECICSKDNFHPNFRFKIPIKKEILTGEEIISIPGSDLIL